MSTTCAHRIAQNRSMPRSHRRDVVHVERLLLICAVAFLCVVAARSLVSPAPPTVPTSTVRVARSETLWKLAVEHPIEGLTTAQTVDVIREINAMDDSTIHEGELVEVPAEPALTTALAQR